MSNEQTIFANFEYQFVDIGIKPLHQRGSILPVDTTLLQKN